MNSERRRILYLDFDGVLHHSEVWWHPKRGPYIKTNDPSHALFQHLPILEKELEPYPDIAIVLSTSWSRLYGYSAAKKKLSPSLQTRVIGSTFHSDMDEQLFLEQSRGEQVWQDTRRRQPLDWIALDDDWLDWPKDCLENFVRTDESAGISHPEVLSELRRKLALMRTP